MPSSTRCTPSWASRGHLYGLAVAKEPIKRVVHEPLRLMEEPFRYILPHRSLASTFGDD